MTFRLAAALSATLLAIFFVPVFYVFIMRPRRRASA